MPNFEKMTNEELKNFWYDQEDFNMEIEQAIWKEISNRIKNGTLKPNYESASDWDLLICNCVED